MDNGTRGRIGALILTAAVVLAACGEGDRKQAAGAGVDKPVPNPLRIASEGSYPPFNMTDASGRLYGFEIDLANDLCRRLQVTCQIQAQNWDGMIPALQTGKYDAIMAGMSITDERLKAVDFSAGYVTTPGYFVASETSPLRAIDFGLDRVNLTEIDAAEKNALDKLSAALKGRAVGVQTATIHADLIEKHLPGVELRRYDTQDNLALDLATGRLDVALADAVAWQSFLKSDNGKTFSFVGPSFDGGLFGRGVGVALRKGEDKLLDGLNGAIAAAKADGTMKRLSVQWFGFDASIP